MKLMIVIGMLFVMAHSVPVPEPEESIDLIKIPLSGNKELDILTLAEQDGSINERNKRTIGILRELFPQLSKLVEQKIQMLIQFAVRTLGPILLRGGLGGGGTSPSTNTDNRKSDDDFDDFDDDENEVGDKDKDKDKSKVSISLPTFAPDSAEVTSSSTSAITSAATDDSSVPSRIDLFDTFDDANSSSTPSVRAVDDVNLLEPSSAGSDALLDTIRVARETNNLSNNQNNQINNDQEPQASEKAKDQQIAAAEAPTSAVDELTLDSIEDDENRGKRFLNFGGSQTDSQASGGSGGSGNFLFDIIRQTADRVARGAGSAFRVVAGTESIDSAIKNFNSDIDVHSNDDQLKAGSSETRSARSGDLSLLVSGSSGTEQTDESQNTADTDVGKGDGYTEGIPGPVTRLFVLANRGLSNLVQDLILRIAQTSERVVNFKARLITSLI